MSITLMCRVWEARDIGPYERLALLSLADHAGEDGRCYPSIRRLCERTGLGERGLQGILKRLVSCGLLVIETSAGRGGANLYLVIAPPAPDAPHPRTGCTPPPHPITFTPAPGAPEPYLTVNEPKCDPMTDAAFETFWQTHPRAANRAETKKAFEAEVARGTSAAWIIHSAKAYKVAEKGTARQYLAQSDNWLKNKRWQDFPELTAANSTAIGDTDATARFWAQTINEGRFVPASAIAPHVAAHMVKSGLVSTAQLAMNGVRL